MAEIVVVTIPQETVNDQSVRLIAWKVASGSPVKEGQLLCEVETSKALVEIEAPASGIARYTALEGSELPVGGIICQIVPEGMDTHEFAPVPRAVEEVLHAFNSQPVSPLPSFSQVAETLNHSAILDSELRMARFTPLAAKLAAEFGFDSASFARGSLVRRDDVLRKAGKLPPKSDNGSSPAFARRSTKTAEAESLQNAPVVGVSVVWDDLPRRKLFEGRILRQGQALTAQSSVTCPVKAPQLRARLEKDGLSLTALVIFEAARLLRKYPVFNALHDRGRIGQYEEINIGCAIDGGDGLMVPVVHQADQKTVPEITGILAGQLDRYLEGTLTPADFLGGTITLSDLSGDRISHFHPLISQGQSAILGIGSDVNDAGYETLYLIMAFDHQIAEGKKAAQFVRELASRLEAQAVLLQKETSPLPSELYCALCMRSGEDLLTIDGMLVRSEVPAGFVCSVCLAGY